MHREVAAEQHLRFLGDRATSGLIREQTSHLLDKVINGCLDVIDPRAQRRGIIHRLDDVDASGRRGEQPAEAREVAGDTLDIKDHSRSLEDPISVAAPASVYFHDRSEFLELWTQAAKDAPAPEATRR